MERNKKLGIGAFLAVFGALGIVLGSTLGLTDLGRPWTFLVGFLVGVVAGIGVALALTGLPEVRRSG